MSESEAGSSYHIQEKDGRPQIWLARVSQEIGQKIIAPTTSRGLARIHAERVASETLDDPIQFWQEDEADGSTEVGVMESGRWATIGPRYLYTDDDPEIRTDGGVDEGSNGRPKAVRRMEQEHAPDCGDCGVQMVLRGVQRNGNDTGWLVQWKCPDCDPERVKIESGLPEGYEVEPLGPDDPDQMTLSQVATDGGTSGGEREVRTVHGVEIRETELGSPWQEKKHGYMAKANFHRRPDDYGGAFGDTPEAAIARLLRAQAKREVRWVRDELERILLRDWASQRELLEEIEDLKDRVEARRRGIDGRYLHTDKTQEAGR